ncbi:MAG: 50S ribosomal protein L1 [bacterium]
MAKRSKRYQAAAKLIEPGRAYDLPEAVAVLYQMPKPKFDATINVVVRLGVDPKRAEQAIRGTLSLPHGVGKERKVLAFAKGEKAQEAQQAGADFVGEKELIEKVAGGWMDFDVAIATPDLMKEVSRLGKVLGPRGLMPSPKSGTVADDVGRAVAEFKKGKISFKNDAYGIVHVVAGKASFPKEKVQENLQAIFQTLHKMKPASAKGTYILSGYLNAAMTPSIKLNTAKL